MDVIEENGLSSTSVTHSSQKKHLGISDILNLKIHLCSPTLTTSWLTIYIYSLEMITFTHSSRVMSKHGDYMSVKDLIPI